MLVPPRLRVLATTPTSATTARVTLRAEAAAAFVVLDSRNVPGAFDDGAFAMLPGVDVSLSFTARRPLSAQQWADEFAVVGCGSARCGTRTPNETARRKTKQGLYR